MSDGMNIEGIKFKVPGLSQEQLGEVKNKVKNAGTNLSLFAGIGGDDKEIDAAEYEALNGYILAKQYEQETPSFDKQKLIEAYKKCEKMAKENGIDISKFSKLDTTDKDENTTNIYEKAAMVEYVKRRMEEKKNQLALNLAKHYSDASIDSIKGYIKDEASYKKEMEDWAPSNTRYVPAYLARKALKELWEFQTKYGSDIAITLETSDLKTLENTFLLIVYKLVGRNDDGNYNVEYFSKLTSDEIQNLINDKYSDESKLDDNGKETLKTLKELKAFKEQNPDFKLEMKNSDYPVEFQTKEAADSAAAEAKQKPQKTKYNKKQIQEYKKLVIAAAKTLDRTKRKQLDVEKVTDPEKLSVELEKADKAAAKKENDKKVGERQDALIALNDFIRENGIPTNVKLKNGDIEAAAKRARRAKNKNVRKAPKTKQATMDNKKAILKAGKDSLPNMKRDIQHRDLDAFANTLRGILVVENSEDAKEGEKLLEKLLKSEPKEIKEYIKSDIDPMLHKNKTVRLESNHSYQEFKKVLEELAKYKEDHPKTTLDKVSEWTLEPVGEVVSATLEITQLPKVARHIGEYYDDSDARQWRLTRIQPITMPLVHTARAVSRAPEAIACITETLNKYGLNQAREYIDNIEVKDPEDNADAAVQGLKKTAKATMGLVVKPVAGGADVFSGSLHTAVSCVNFQDKTNEMIMEDAKIVIAKAADAIGDYSIENIREHRTAVNILARLGISNKDMEALVEAGKLSEVLEKEYTAEALKEIKVKIAKKDNDGNKVKDKDGKVVMEDKTITFKPLPAKLVLQAAAEAIALKYAEDTSKILLHDREIGISQLQRGTLSIIEAVKDSPDIVVGLADTTQAGINATQNAITFDTSKSEGFGKHMKETANAIGADGVLQAADGALDTGKGALQTLGGIGGAILTPFAFLGGVETGKKFWNSSVDTMSDGVGNIGGGAWKAAKGVGNTVTLGQVSATTSHFEDEQKKPVNRMPKVASESNWTPASKAITVPTRAQKMEETKTTLLKEYDKAKANAIKKEKDKYIKDYKDAALAKAQRENITIDSALIAYIDEHANAAADALIDSANETVKLLTEKGHINPYDTERLVDLLENSNKGKVLEQIFNKLGGSYSNANSVYGERGSVANLESIGEGILLAPFRAVFVNGQSTHDKVMSALYCHLLGAIAAGGTTCAKAKEAYAKYQEAKANGSSALMQSAMEEFGEVITWAAATGFEVTAEISNKIHCYELRMNGSHGGRDLDFSRFRHDCPENGHDSGTPILNVSKPANMHKIFTERPIDFVVGKK